MILQTIDRSARLRPNHQYPELNLAKIDTYCVAHVAKLTTKYCVNKIMCFRDHLFKATKLMGGIKTYSSLIK